MKPCIVIGEIPTARRHLGNAERSHGALFVRLSRLVDPTRKRYLVTDPRFTLAGARKLAHRLSVEVLREGLRRKGRA